jgi:NAD(P)-dependent dehydrogenase (short-subunit alcohol dehydrogenase family)
MTKPICLITGATDGVGKLTAMELASMGFMIVMAARNAAKAETVRREIAAATGNNDVDFIAADLGSLRQTRELANTFKRRFSHLDVLINNAGIFLPTRTVTEDNFETMFQVNYLSHFLLTSLLLDEIRNSGQGRIINLTSNVYAIGKFDVKNLQGERRFSGIGAYAASKLMMLMFTEELAKRQRAAGVTANAVHPGIVRTQMMLGASGLFKVISLLARPFAVSPREGAATSVYLASSSDVAGVSGRYFANCKPQDARSKFDTEENRELLWGISMTGSRASE